MYFHSAPKSTSRDVVALSVKDVSTLQPAPDTRAGANSPRLVTLTTPSHMPPSGSFSPRLVTLTTPSHMPPTGSFSPRLVTLTTPSHMPTSGSFSPRLVTLTTPASMPPSGSFTSEPKASSTATPGLGELQVTDVTPNALSLDWAAPERIFDSFVVELKALSGQEQARGVTVPGGMRKANVQGLSPKTHYEVTLYGMVEGRRSLPLTAFANTGIWSR